VNFKRILVPLDGSRLAETILPPARSLAETLDAQLLLLHVLEQSAPPEVHGERHLADVAEAQAYLATQAEQAERSGIATEVHVHERRVHDVAAAIDQHAHELGADLLAMCAHGRSNLRMRLIGSIAERILRGGSVPILLRTVRRAGGSDFALRKVLVPLDFEHDVEAALSAASTLASAYEAEVILLSAPDAPEPTATRLLPGTAELARRFDEAALRRRLDALASTLRESLRAVETIVDDGAATKAIISAAISLPADLIVLVTDAHGGLSRWYDPSTGQQLLSRPDLTLLLIKEL
jgi:nucleotide-binding universal stress UspA family protein